MEKPAKKPRVNKYGVPYSRGKPSYDAAALKPAITKRMAAGESLTKILESDGMPGLNLVFQWLANDSQFADEYARAREAQADKMAAEILAIADTPVIGIKKKTDETGKVEVTEADMIEHRRLQVDARKWLAARMAPKKWGDKMGIGQADGMDPLRVDNTVTMTPAESYKALLNGDA
jgi:hypothetical protein